MILTKFKFLPVALATLLLSACGSSDNTTSASCNADQFNMAIQTVAPNFGKSSAVALGCSTEATITDNLLIEDDSDYSVSSGSDSFYHIGRDSIDTIAKYQFETSNLQDWKYSTNDALETGSSNPYKLIEVSDTKAYIIRYGKSDAWIVDPSATNSSDFKIGELDLSGYLEEGEATVNMSDAVIANGKLFIAMQRIGSSYNFSNDSKIAVFDVLTDTEIETSPANAADGKAITIQGHNVQALSSFNNTVFVASRGDYAADYGLLESINTSDFSLQTIISGSEEIGHIENVEAISSDRIYILSDFSGSIAGTYTYQLNIHDVNVITKSITAELTSYKGTHISDIEMGPEGNLWIASSVSSNPGVYKIDTNTNTEIAFIETNQNPTKVVFKK
ncbi:MAG: hypothetical protein ACJA0E_001058 [Bermanella sp.]|jgi:hypothetical protein